AHCLSTRSPPITSDAIGNRAANGASLRRSAAWRPRTSSRSSPRGARACNAARLAATASTHAAASMSLLTTACTIATRSNVAAAKLDVDEERREWTERGLHARVGHGRAGAQLGERRCGGILELRQQVDEHGAMAIVVGLAADRGDELIDARALIGAGACDDRP